MNTKIKQLNKIRRHKRVRATVKGTAERPRVSVFKSSRHLFVQFVDDQASKTVLSSDASVGVPTKTSGQLKNKAKDKLTKTEKAAKIGEMLAEKAKESGIKEVVFDRGGFKYHGRIKAVADGLRKGGLKV
ncbi:MAG: 50S ribosomal protein L18 [Candidatus Yanofskybacteria bacterium RIFCSPHIGHO2_01_FULL_43_42]|uniref:Large ribosomal subunit protein uL18 n=1 Tax=Candidatus Yanofskybacteria bacterium RIFCSPLOWO2_01_FULL_43_22 TaxID=1802695 RepID=A0A1F8GEI9_9BACT|nr:MAG: 50S ribosomal protein L18 [Candidatus Yanofskybacteria bacterium RIFCSPHIGHO2_01_FULL_43_42]OGN12586.1 MAG: 50S ribosomal protein L18 [Candidatus Yanofskybacteria bacterium RIFCSPHIGHO2_02_FULL_43_17]OGN23733.1 MAG: 50S ribosomal protein L18 [Candidatus Yanofskybacteria bacterium RIFCSPLOWO2_01_FULL_43_22]